MVIGTVRVMLLLFLVSVATHATFGQSKVFCDSLIKQGVNAMFDQRYTAALELLTQARTIAEDRQWHNQIFLSKNNIGLTYFMMSEYGDALDFFQESYRIAIDHLTPKDEMIVLNNIAILYTKEKEFTKAIDHFKRAYDLAVENDVKIKQGFYGVNLGLAYNETGDLKTARKYLDDSWQYIQDNPDVTLQAEIGMAENEFLAGNLEASSKRNNDLLKKITTKEPNKVTAVHLLLSKINLTQRNYDSALHHTDKALLADKSLESKKSIYETVAAIWERKGDFRRAAEFKDSLLFIQEKLNQMKNAALFQNSKVKFELQNYQHELELNQQRLSTERKVFYSVIVAILIVIFAIFRVRAVRHQQQIQIEARSKQIVELQLEKERQENLLLEKQLQEKETLSLLEQERFKNEMEAKNRELSAKALYLSGRNQLIEEIITSLSKVPEFVQNQALMQPVKALRNQLKTDHEWESFMEHFEQVNHGLIGKLKTAHPSLTANDIRFISYIYMNMLPKEIAAIFNITQEAFRKRKERITQKLQLSEDETLYDYLSKL